MKIQKLGIEERKRLLVHLDESAYKDLQAYLCQYISEYNETIDLKKCAELIIMQLMSEDRSFQQFKKANARNIEHFIVQLEAEKVKAGDEDEEDEETEKEFELEPEEPTEEPDETEEEPEPESANDGQGEPLEGDREGFQRRWASP